MATITAPQTDRTSSDFSRTAGGRCRFCDSPLEHTFINLGKSPLCESYLPAEQLNDMEPYYPLHAYVCAECFLVQLEQYVSGEEIFREYAYFSSFSDSWLAHAERYTEQMIATRGLSNASQVIEVASNDGYLLQYFVARGVPALGIEPAANVARVAIEKGIPTLIEFFGVAVAEQIRSRGLQADLLIGNNVLAQVNDINDFVAGLAIALKPRGVITLEFPHLMQLVAQRQFDTIYHEHFSYFSLSSAERILAAHGLVVYDVEELSTHGGSLRLYARHERDEAKSVTARTYALREREVAAGVLSLDYYASFTPQVEALKRDLLEFLIDAKRSGKRIVGYGAPGKGNTLLNYCGIRTDFIDFTVDRSTYKQGKILPGTEIPIRHPDAIREARPDYVLIMPWNLREEIAEQLAYVREWGGRLVVAIPKLEILS